MIAAEYRRIMADQFQPEYMKGYPQGRITVDVRRRSKRRDLTVLSRIAIVLRNKPFRITTLPKNTGDC